MIARQVRPLRQRGKGAAIVYQLNDDSPGEGQRSFRRLLERAGLTSVPTAALAGVAVLLVLALAVTGWRLGTSEAEDSATGFTLESAGAQAEPGAVPGADALDSAAEESAAAAAAAAVWVHVAGAVHAPGLRELPGGSRVGDAINAAGGQLPEASLDAVNLAQLLVDGEQVYVPTTEEVAAGVAAPLAARPPGGTAGGAASGQTKVDINAASQPELEELPGIGPATAAKIIADREASGPFQAPEDLMRVSGIGEKKFEALRDLIMVR